MDVSVLSDLHIDFYIKQKDPNRISKLLVENAFNKYLDKSEEVEVLIVAGDLGHHNAQTLKVLKLISEVFNYKKIFAVTGNHDLYFSSNHYSKSRAEELWNYKDPDEVLYILNGTVEEYKGIRFGGAMGFYDATYLQVLRSTVNPLSLWRERMNDYNYIKGMGDFYDIIKAEREKLFKIKDDCDVIITHVNPSVNYHHQFTRYRDDVVTAFFCWDGSELLDSTSASYLFYGHSHGRFDYTEKGVQCILNSLGYPQEPAKKLTLTLEI